MSIPYFMVFDVESVGLHGEGFAVGWVVIRADGGEVESGCLSCPPAAAAGADEGRAWVQAHIPPLRIDAPNPQLLRESFWEHWQRIQATWQGVVMAADVPWPVEARFLIDCVNEDLTRAGSGPYPLVDVASVRLAAGLDPSGIEERLPAEDPAHHPLTDARQSARLLVEALKVSIREREG